MMESQSFRTASWRRLKKNKGAILGLFLIIVAIFVAIFAYFIAPDPSPYANRIILEIGGNKPGFTQEFIKVRKEKNVTATSWLSRLANGKEDAYYFIPIVNSATQGDSIIVQKFIDEGLSERIA